MLSILYQKPSALKLNEKNPRKNDHVVDRIADSITEFGFTNPILIDKNNEIIAGHTRLKAAINLGLKEVPTIALENLTPAQAKAYMIADNKLNELAEWNNDVLKELLHELPPTINTETLGFTQAELDQLIHFTPNLPTDEPEPEEVKSDYTIVVMCKDEDSQQELFLELRDRGFTVK